MFQNELPEEVKRLIAEHIVSVEQLEVLLLLHAQPEREWSAKDVADQIRTSESSAATRLVDLAGRGFLVSGSSGQDGYRYAPAEPRRVQAVDLLARVYAEKRYTVIELIFSKPIDNLRVYANAFRFRKDDSDG